MGARVLGGIGSAGLFLAILGVGPGPSVSRALAPPPASPALRGAGSCSATACHGEARPSGSKVLRNEHTTWVRLDRHADAFTALTGERARSIAAKLSGVPTPAEDDARCLACHSTGQREPAAGRSPALLREGVGCESCHGAADRWLGVHTRWDWAGRSPEDKEAFGMVDTADLARRARACAGCHVGQAARDGLPARDVDHEMIAAGHPRLNFEFSAYLATMTHHWRDDVGPDSTPDFPARAWAIGQLVSARSAVELLRDRARRARPDPRQDRPADWPELAEYSCYSCHHDLLDDPWRRRRSDAPGSPRWNPWPFSILETIPGSTVEGLKPLRDLMGEARPEPAMVIRLAGPVSTALDRRIKALSGRGLEAAEVEAMFSSVASLPTRGGVESWEQATQRYLALVPLGQSLRSMAPSRSDPRLLDELKALRDSLRFPKGFDSPKSFNPAEVPALRRPF